MMFSVAQQVENTEMAENIWARRPRTATNAMEADFVVTLLSIRCIESNTAAMDISNRLQRVALPEQLLTSDGFSQSVCFCESVAIRRRSKNFFCTFH